MLPVYYIIYVYIYIYTRTTARASRALRFPPRYRARFARATTVSRKPYHLTGNFGPGGFRGYQNIFGAPLSCHENYPEDSPGLSERPSHAPRELVP